MTDEDICGASTTGEEPCQNPAGENGRCWIPSHNESDAENPHGRPSLLEEHEEDIINAAREGLTYEGIARVAGIGVRTLHDWREEYEDFSQSLERARSEAERDLIQDVDPEFVLERSYDYVKTERREVDLDADVDGTHDVTAEFVTYSPEEDDDE
jgi:transposase-like protein